MTCLRESILAHERKVIAFVAKVNSRCFLWYPTAILVYHGGTPIWRLHTELYKFPRSVSANNSRTLYRTDLRLGEVVYLLIFDNIWNSWFLLLNGFERDSATRQYTMKLIAAELMWSCVWKKNIKIRHIQYRILTTRSLMYGKASDIATKPWDENEPECAFWLAQKTGGEEDYSNTGDSSLKDI